MNGTVYTTGFELEFCSALSRIELARALPACICSSAYTAESSYDTSSNLGTDMSIQPEYGKLGLELRTKVWPIEFCPQPFIPDFVFESLDVLKRTGCTTNRRCGIHIHVSQDKPFTFKDLAVFEERIVKLRKCIFNERHEYAKETSVISLRDHHSEISLKSDKHFEIRIFNGTLSKRALRNYYNLLFKVD